MADVIKKETTISHDNAPVVGTDPPTVITPKVERHQSLIYIIYFLFGALEILLAFRLIFRLAGANPSSTFVSFVYALSDLFVWPFTGIFGTATARGAETTAVFEPATIVAIVVYAVLAWGFARLVVIMSGRIPVDA